MVDLYKIKKDSEEQFDKEKFWKVAEAIVKITLNIIGIPPDLIFSLKEARKEAFLQETISILKANIDELQFEQLQQTEDISSIKIQLNKFIEQQQLIKSEFLALIKKQFSFPQTLSPLQTYFSQLPSKDPHKFLFDNDLIYFPETEVNIINQIENQFLENKNKYALISGIPETGKSILGYKIGFNLIEKGYSVFYIRFDSLPDKNLLWQDLLFLNTTGKSLIIADNSHISLNDAAYIIQNYDKIQNLNFLFLSRPTDKYEQQLSEYDNVSFKDYFDSTYYNISLESFTEKAAGIIHKYKKWYENKYNESLVIGNEKFVINNSQRNLLTLYYNLLYWKPSTRLDKHIDKEQIFRDLFDEYLKGKNLEKLLLIASLYKYEIYYEAKDNETEELNNLVNDGILRNHPFSPYYYLYHSSFAKLLLNTFTIHTSFKRYNDLEYFCLLKLQDYILSFDDYPLNLGELFHNLVNNHGQSIAVKLLRNENIYKKFINYYLNNGQYLKLLFILYRIGKKNKKLVKTIFNKLPAKKWAEDFRNFSIAGISVGLLKLNNTAPEKALEVLSEFNIKELIEFSFGTKFNLLANSLRELDLLSGQRKIGYKIYQALSMDQILTKIYDSSLSHIGKGLSELYRVDKQKTKSIVNQLNIEKLQHNFKDYNIKYISKMLNELSELDQNVAISLFHSLDNNKLIENLKLLEVEGIGRSLKEFNKIDSDKARELFLQLEDQFLLELLNRSSLEQISQSLSELNAVDKEKTKYLFQSLDNQTLLNKLHNKNLTFQKIGIVVHNFKKYDDDFSRIRYLLSKADRKNIVKKASAVDFNNFCISIASLKSFDNELAIAIWKSIDKAKLLLKAQSEHLKNIGGALNKLKNFDKISAYHFAEQINWENVIDRSKNITFTQLANSLTNLKSFNKTLARKIYNLFEINWLVRKAKNSQTSLIKDSLRKLRTIDEKKSREIFELLDIK